MGSPPVKRLESRRHGRTKFSKHLLITFPITILLINIPSTSAEIRDIKISSWTRFRYIAFDGFFFTNKGHISINISSISLHPHYHVPKIKYNSSLAMFATPRTFFKKAVSRFDTETCVLDGDRFIKPFFVLHDFPSLPSSINNSIELTVLDPGTYEVFLLNCNPFASLSIDLHLEMYEIDENGEKSYVQKNYLLLPFVYSISSLAFFLLLLIWILICHYNKLSLKKIHLLMGFFLFVKFLDLFCHAQTLYATKAFGYSNGWKILWHSFHFLQGSLILLIIGLIGDGWSCTRPLVSQDGKSWIMIFFVLHIVSSLCGIASHEISGRHDINQRAYILGAHGFDILAWMIITFRPIGPMIQYLAEDYSTREGKARKSLVLLKRLRNLTYALFGNLFINKFGVQLVGRFVLNVNPRANWGMFASIEQVLEILFYVILFLTFKPNHRDDNLWPKWLGPSSDDVIPNKYDEEASRFEIQTMYARLFALVLN